MTDTIDYGNLMHDAMRGLIQQVLQDIAADGLPGDHHFFITFDTRHPDVKIADWLSERYPGEMTIVVQHWFDDLTVTNDGFSITLNFGDNPEPLYIPFDGLKTFVDPSVEFGLRFDSRGSSNDDADIVQIEGVTPVAVPARSDPKKTAGKAATPKKTETGDAEVVSLDNFRK